VYILGIETSCDETALALVRAAGDLKSGPKFEVIKEEVASQVKIHRPFGGVVPNLAKREHAKNLPLLFRQIFGTPKSEVLNPKQTQNSKSKTGKKFHDSRFTIHDVDLIAVTVGPGLEPALWQVITFAQELGKKYKKPVIGVNHLEGHLYSFLLPKTSEARNTKSETKKGFALHASRFTNVFPAVALIVSGGHTVLLFMKNLKSWKRLGETRDDAAGEAFDKVARILKLPYPGGPEIQKLVLSLPRNWKDKIIFPGPMLNNKDYDFSFSGLKTAVLYYVRDHNVCVGLRSSPRRSAFIAEVAGAFSAAATDVLVKKTMRAARDFGAKSVMLSGGVAANKILRERLEGEADKNNMGFFVAEHKYNTDNAAMIAAAGYLGVLRKKKLKLEADGMMGI